MSGRHRWRKSWEEKWRDEASDTLGVLAKLLRALLGDIAELEDGSDVGWAIDARGRPYTPVRLAILLSSSVETVSVPHVQDALQQLADAGVTVTDGVRVGVVNWRSTQEDPSAQRQRNHRARQRDGGRDSHAQKTEDRRQNQGEEEDAREAAHSSPRNAEQTIGRRLSQSRLQLGWSEALAAKRANMNIATLRQLERDEDMPVASELEALAAAYGDPELAHLKLPDRDPNVARAVVHAYHQHAQDLGRIARNVPLPEPTPDDVRVVWSTGEGPQTQGNWLTVLARFAQQGRRERERGKTWAVENFTLRVLASPRVRPQYLERIDLDTPPPEARQRAPPGRGSGATEYKLGVFARGESDME